jgi:hypothetical protein
MRAWKPISAFLNGSSKRRDTGSPSEARCKIDLIQLNLKKRSKISFSSDVEDKEVWKMYLFEMAMARMWDAKCIALFTLSRLELAKNIQTGLYAQQAKKQQIQYYSQAIGRPEDLPIFSKRPKSGRPHERLLQRLLSSILSRLGTMVKNLSTEEQAQTIPSDIYG